MAAEYFFDELLERVRDIRSSEKVLWRKVLDIYATSIDYDPKGENPAQSEALVAKNYCNEEELSALNSVVSAYLEFAEMQARRRIPMYMFDWIETLDGI